MKGVPIGTVKHWRYENCIVIEEKIAPGKWRGQQTATKGKISNRSKDYYKSPKGGTYTWGWKGIQRAHKISPNDYQVTLDFNKRFLHYQPRS